jgi:outer membrane lipoprotein-sorting protein
MGFSQDKKAEAILKSLSEKTMAYESIKIQFAYQLDNEDAGVHNEMLGTLITSGEKYRLSLGGQLIICDGTSVWTFIEEAEEVQISNVEDSEGSVSPADLLGNYSEQYKAKYKDEKVINGRKMDILELVPYNKEVEQEIFMAIDKVKNEPYYIKIVDEQDVEITFQVNEFLTNISLPEGSFKFDFEAYPDIDVNDMR